MFFLEFKKNVFNRKSCQGSLANIETPCDTWCLASHQDFCVIVLVIIVQWLYTFTHLILNFSIRLL
jgi:hypothetical protein